MVFMPRRRSHESKGARPDPSAFCTKAMRLEISGSRTQTTPPVTSECPDRYLVAEWMTMSAPSLQGPFNNS